MLNFVIGLLLGFCLAIAVLCCVQVNRIRCCEQEIRRLKDKLNSRD